MHTKKQPLLRNVLICSTAMMIFFDIIPSFSQDHPVDEIRLTSGSIIRGSILEMTDSNSLSIETLCHNILVFDAGDIEKVKFDALPAGYFTSASKRPAKKKGYFNSTEAGALIGSGNNDHNTVASLQMTNGYRFNSRYFAGLGTGLEFFEQVHMPFFADARMVLTESKIAPVLLLKGGYSIVLENLTSSDWGTYTAKGGLMYGAGAGLQFRLSPHNTLLVNFLYRYQDIEMIYNDPWIQSETKFKKKIQQISSSDRDCF